MEIINNWVAAQRERERERERESKSERESERGRGEGGEGERQTEGERGGETASEAARAIRAHSRSFLNYK